MQEQNNQEKNIAEEGSMIENSQETTISPSLDQSPPIDIQATAPQENLKTEVQAEPSESPQSGEPKAEKNNKKSGSSLWKILLGLLILGIISVAGYLAYENMTQSPITSYDECILVKGSIIQESYPSVCVTREGLRFVQEIEEPIVTEPTPTKAEVCYDQVTNVVCDPPGSACMTNPASSFCICMGGTLETLEDEEGGQYGVCTIDGEKYDEWDYFRSMQPEDMESEMETSDVTPQELEQGWYWGSFDQKKPGTPDTWIHTGEGTRSAKWYDPYMETSVQSDGVSEPNSPFSPMVED